MSLCGTGDSQELLRTLGTAFEKANPGVAMVVPDSVGSDGGIKAAAAGECDFGRVARPLKDQEKELNLNYKVISFSPVVFVVDPATGVENLTSKQIVDIFSGKVAAWAEVGGKGGKIAVVNREAKDSSRGELNKHVEGFKAIENPVGADGGQKRPRPSNCSSKTPGAVGYLPAAMTKGLKLKVVKVNGVAPTAANVLQGVYEIAAPFGLVWKGELKPAANRFFQFIKSAEGKKIIIDYGPSPPTCWSSGSRLLSPQRREQPFLHESEDLRPLAVREIQELDADARRQKRLDQVPGDVDPGDARAAPQFLDALREHERGDEFLAQGKGVARLDEDPAGAQVDGVVREDLPAGLVVAHEHPRRHPVRLALDDVAGGRGRRRGKCGG